MPVPISPETPEVQKEPTSGPAASTRPTFQKAIQSWIPLLQAKSKDQERWEEVLIRSDMGPQLAQELLNELALSSEEPQAFFVNQLKTRLRPAQSAKRPWNESRPWVCFVVGVNGVGKTSTITKLGHFLHSQSKSVGVVGADTFRKAAIEQLERSCEKNGLEFFSIKNSEEDSEGADPSAVIFDGLKRFQQKEVILVDTSGRLHTKKNLMEELKKMKRVADKVIPGAPQDVWLVLDSTLGQNALHQAKVFHESVELTGLVLTKLDGLSKGGVIFQLYRELKTPIWFLTHGENVNDISIFEAENFVEELFDL